MTDTKVQAEKKPAKSNAELPGVDFDSLRPGMCKFPLGGIDEPPGRFCGEPASNDKPYCPECAAKAYNRPERRR